MNSDRLITRSVKVEIEPSGAELATVFWAMCAEDQAVFFNTLERISDGRLVFQLQSLTDCETLEAGGRTELDVLKRHWRANTTKADEQALKGEAVARPEDSNKINPFSLPEEDEAWREAQKKINPVWQSPHRAGAVCITHGIRYAAYEQCPVCVLAVMAKKERTKQNRYQDTAGEDWVDEVLTPEIEKIRDCINRLMKVEKER